MRTSPYELILIICFLFFVFFLQNRLAELGMVSTIAPFRNHRAVQRLVIPYSEFDQVKALVKDII